MRVCRYRRVGEDCDYVGFNGYIVHRTRKHDRIAEVGEFLDFRPPRHLHLQGQL